MTIQEIVSIEEIATDVQSGFASGERTADGVVQLRMNNVTTEGSLNWSSYIRVPTSQKQIEKYQLRPGDILFNSTNSPELVGKTAVFKDFGEPVVFSNHFVRLRVDEKRVDPQYLAAWFVKQWQNRVFESLCTQWVNQATVRKEDLLDLKLPLPPLTEQKRIASLLARADRLRTLRRAARGLADSLLQSVFLEMFGEENYGLMELRDVVKIDRTIANENDVKTLPYVGLEDIEKDAGDFAKEYRPIPQNMLATNFKFTPNHVLYGKLRPYLNKVVMPLFSGVCTTEILPLLPVKGKIHKTYLWAYLRSKKFVEWASNNVSGANLPRLSPELLGDYPLPVPPLPLQEEFARVVVGAERRSARTASIEGLRRRMAEAERQAEGLFQSLLAESFS